MRYDRMKLVTKNFEELKKKTAVVVGCGNLGTKNARLLAHYGINLVLIDFDKVSEPNLGTQEYEESDLENFKAEQLKKHIVAMNSGIKVASLNEKLTYANAQKLLKGADIVVDSCDNLETRFVINDSCKAISIPWVYGSVEKNSGIVAAFGKRYWFEKLVNRNAKAKKVDEVGVTPEVAAVVSAIQVHEAIKLLAESKSSNEILMVNLDNYFIDSIKNQLF